MQMFNRNSTKTDFCHYFAPDTTPTFVELEQALRQFSLGLFQEPVLMSFARPLVSLI